MWVETNGTGGIFMRNWLSRMAASMARFMYGRNGFDELSKMLFIASIVLYVLSGFVLSQVLYPVSLLLLLYSMFRCYSRKLDKRQKELQWYQNKITEPLRMKKRIWSDRKTYKYFRCKQCGTYLRVPKGAGKIIITCPHCKNKAEAKA